MKRGSCDHFLSNLKSSNPSKAGDGWIQNFFLIDFDIWNVENGVRMRKLDQFYEIDSELEDKTGTMRAKLVTIVRI